MTPIPKILALDVGEKRIGVASSDALGLMAHGVTVLERRNVVQDISRIKEIIEEYEIERVVIGLPINMNGSVGAQAQKVAVFCTALKKELSLPVVAWDERLSTQAAHWSLDEAGLNWRKKRKVVDKLAAVLILQSYLDCKKHLESPLL